MNTASATLTANSENTASESPKPARRLRSELIFLGLTYLVTFFFASLSLSLCGPGCCYIFYSIIAGISGFLMLRQRLLSRIVCLGVLLFSLFGMWHEKEARETWGARSLRLQIQNLEQELQKAPPK